jgi:hypothetical protein
MRTSATIFAACILSASVGAYSTARADVDFVVDSTFGCGKCTLLFGAQGSGDQSGNSVTAFNNDGMKITYTSNDLLFAAGGQAEINALPPSKSFDDLFWKASLNSISNSWTAETFSVNVLNNGEIDLLVTTNTGVQPVFEWDVSKNGENKISLFAINGQSILSVSLLSDVGITSFRQDRITSETVTPIPLPPALILFGTALAGMGFLGRRRARLGTQMAS